MKRVLKAGSILPRGNQFLNKDRCVFDYDIGAGYDARWFETEISYIFSDLGYEVTDVNVTSVSYPRGKVYSQAAVDFLWSVDYDEQAIEDALIDFTDNEGGNFFGIEFQSLDF